MQPILLKILLVNLFRRLMLISLGWESFILLETWLKKREWQRKEAWLRANGTEVSDWSSTKEKRINKITLRPVLCSQTKRHLRLALHTFQAFSSPAITTLLRMLTTLQMWKEVLHHKFFRWKSVSSMKKNYKSLNWSACCVCLFNSI